MRRQEFMTGLGARTFSILPYPVKKVPELRPGLSTYLDWRTRG
jgi:hypothetical protein